MWLDELLDRARAGASPDELARIASRGPVEKAARIAAAECLFDAEPTGTDAVGLQAGDRVGPYCLQRELGHGGQALVYVAEDTRTHKLVALKLLPGAGAGSLRLQRFRREAAITASLHHPGICTIYDVGQSGSTAWIAMQLVDGEPLSEWRSTHHLPHRTVRDYLVLVARVAETLHAAHEAGVVHRDVKPANIMVDRASNPVVLDFGLAAAGDSSLTVTGAHLGTPAYMAPEQVLAQHDTVDARTDVWALGVTLYEGLMVRRPFDGPTHAAIYRAILQDEPAALRGRHVSRDLALVVRTALDKNRNNRYRTAAAFAEDLRRVADGTPVLARPPALLRRLFATARRHPATATAVTFALVLLLIVGAGLAGSWRSRLSAACTAWQRSRIDDALDALGELPSWVVATFGESGLATLAMRDHDGDPVRAIVQHVRRGNTARALFAAATPLRVAGPHDSVAKTFLERALVTSVNGTGPFPLTEVLGTLGRLFTERPVLRTEADAWESVRQQVRALWSRMEQDPDRTPERLELMTILYGLGEPQDAATVLAWMNDPRRTPEEHRRGMTCVVAIVCRTRQNASLSRPAADLLWANLLPALRAKLAADDRSDHDALLTFDVARALAIAERAVTRTMSHRSELQSCRDYLNRSCATQRGCFFLDNLRVLCAAGDAESVHAVLPSLLDGTLDGAFEYGWCSALLGRDTLLSLATATTTEPDLKKSLLAGMERGRLDHAAEWIVPPDRDSKLGEPCPGECTDIFFGTGHPPTLPFDNILAHWSFQGGGPSRSGTAGAVILRGADLSSESPCESAGFGPSFPFLRLYRFDESEVTLDFDVTEPVRLDDEPLLVLTHERGNRPFLPHGGSVWLKINCDGVTISDAPLQNGRTELCGYRLSADLLRKGKHHLSLRLMPGTTTTYRILDAAIVLAPWDLHSVKQSASPR